MTRTAAPHTAFFGDAEYAFRLSPALIIELEHKTGAGIGALCTRIFNRQFTQSDIHETIRLSLIGGGLPPLIDPWFNPLPAYIKKASNDNDRYQSGSIPATA